MKLPSITLSDQAAIIAGLRLLQVTMSVGGLTPDLHNILTDGDTLVPVSSADIDTLVEAINGSAADESFEDDGKALPYGRCDSCGQPDSAQHHCKRVTEHSSMGEGRDCGALNP